MKENKHWLSQIKLGEWYSNSQYNYRPRNDKERNLMHSCYEEGYNKGYEDGKPKWHILKENPNYLPKNREEVLLYVKLHDKWERECVLIGYIDFGDCLGEYCKDWGYVEPIRNCKYDFVDGEEVIAWCEFPKFKE